MVVVLVVEVAMQSYKYEAGKGRGKGRGLEGDWKGLEGAGRERPDPLHYGMLPGRGKKHRAWNF